MYWIAPWRPPSAAETSAWRRRVSSGGIIGSHWNGVNGFGTKVDTARWSDAAPPFAARRAAARDRLASSAMATTSSSRSSGRPIMK